MKRFVNLMAILLSVAVITSPISCVQNPTGQETENYGPATQKLIKLLEDDPALKAMLETSIAKAKAINPDQSTNPAQSLEEYFAFVSHAETAMPWALLPKDDYPEIYHNMLQGIVYFYFLIDQPLDELEGMGLFHNSLQYGTPFASWVTTFCQSWGQFLDTDASWSEESYQIALNDPKFGLQEGWYEDPMNWKTFNEFFARHLRSPEARPIADPDDDAVVVSFADSEPQGVWAIDDSSMLVDVPIKTSTINSIAALLGKDSQYANAFANGTFTHSFLNVNDYHRYHFPVGGTIKEAHIISGINPTGATIFWDATNKRYAFDPSRVGWQMVETRGCVIVDSEEFGLVAMLPIGMAMVGSVNFEDSVKPGAEVKKGDPLGYFLFGGSDFIVLFQEQVEFSLDAPRQPDSKYYQHLLMGERLGQLTVKE